MSSDKQTGFTPARVDSLGTSQSFPNAGGSGLSSTPGKLPPAGLHLNDPRFQSASAGRSGGNALSSASTFTTPGTMPTMIVSAPVETTGKTVGGVVNDAASVASTTNTSILDSASVKK